MKRSFFIFAVLFFVFLFISCQSKVKVYKASLFPELKKRGMEVLLASPQGKVEAERESDAVVVTFNQPMVPLSESGHEEYKKYMRIDPYVKGKFRWQGTATLAFIPEDQLPRATSFKVTIPKGIESVSGEKLKEAYSWSFETLRPELLGSYPKHEDQDTSLNSNIYLYFNQSVAFNKVKDFIKFKTFEKFETLEQQENKEEIPFNIRMLQNDEEKKIKDWGWEPKNVVVIDPVNNLLQELSYNLELLPNLPSNEGSLGLEKERVLSFRTYDYFKLYDFRAPVDPEAEIRFSFTNPVITKELIKYISFTPPVKIPEHYKDDSYECSTYCDFYLPFLPEKEYEVKVSKDLKDVFNNSLEKDITYKFKTASFKPSISIPEGEGVVESYEDLNFPVRFLNINKVKKQLLLLNKDDIIIEREKFFEYDKPYIPKKGYFDVDKLWDINIPKNEKKFLPLDLKDVLPPGKKGVVFLQVDHSAHLSNYNRYFKSLLQITNLGVTAKFSPESNLVWVTNLKDASSVNNATVEIRDDNNKVLFKGITDKNGFVETPGWAKLGLKKDESWGYPKQWIFVSKHDDFTFLNSEWQTGVHPYHFNIDYNWDPKPKDFSGYIFTDRGLYRANEEVNIKGVLREKGFGKWGYPDIKEVKVIIKDSRDKTVLDKKVSVSSLGSFDLTYSLKEDAASGFYDIQVSDAKKKDLFELYGSFRVEAYTPAQFEVSVVADKDSYIFKDKFMGYIKGRYLFGAPMNNEKVSWSLRLDPSYFVPPGFDDYSFGTHDFIEDNSGSSEESTLIASGEGVFDKNGRVNVESHLDSGKVNNSMNLVFEGTVTSQNKQTVSGRRSIVVHKGEYYIGIKIPDRFGSVRNKVNINLIAVTPDGKKRKENVNVKIFKRIYHSARKAGIEGVYEWVTEEEDKELLSKRVNTDAVVDFTPPSSGAYIVTAEGEDRRGNKIKTDSYFYAWGDDYYPWERRDDDKIEIIKDKTNYKPGDTARLIVKSPYDKARALVTVEREYVVDKFIVENLSSSQVINLPIKNEYLPNVFVSVVLLKGRVTDKHFSSSGDDLGKPSFKIGYVSLPVNPEEKRLNIKVNLEKKEFMPGDLVDLEVEVKDKNGKGVFSELTVSAADEGVLSLINYNTPNPFDSFYSQRELSVDTSETRVHVVGVRNYGEKGSNRGGGGGLDDSGYAYRSKFKATAYWNPKVVTDKEGRAKISFKLPDNLTTFRVMAIAHNKDSFGGGEEKLIVKKPLVMLPSTPRFARVGDSFTAGVLVHNNSNKDEMVEVTGNANGIGLSGKNSEKFNLKSGDEKEVLFSYNAKAAGDAVLYFNAIMGREKDSLKLTVPVKLPRIEEAYAAFNDITENIQEALFIPKDIYPGGYLELTASSTALLGLRDGIEYLASYPYECLEQRISKILPLILAEKLINSFDISVVRGGELRKVVANNIKSFKRFQKESGGFGYWEDSTFESPYLSAYLLYALHHAQKHNYTVDKYMVKKSLSYLRKALSWGYPNNSPYSENGYLSEKAFILYVLSLWGVNEESYFNLLYEKLDQMPVSGKAVLLKAANIYGKENEKAKILEALVNKIKISPATAHFEDEYEGYKYIFDSNVKVTSIVLQSILEVNGEFPHSSKMAKWLLESKKKRKLQNTHENQYFFNALLTYFERYEKIKPYFKAEIILEQKTVLNEIFKGRDFSLVKNKITLDAITKEKKLPLEIKMKGKGRLYYGIRLLYSSLNTVPRDEGLIVLKNIEPLEKEGRGSIYKVTLTVLSPQDQLFVAVDDPVPAGFEVVNSSFYTESDELKRKLSKMQGKKKWRGTFEHFEIYDDKILLFSDYLQRGEHKYTYFMKSLHSGKFLVPFTKAECMYEPEVFGTSEQKYIEIK